MRPLRHPVVQAVLSWSIARWMAFCFATIRWTHVNRVVAEQVWDQGGGVICAFWHSRIGLSPSCWPLDRAQPAKALISLSPDGQFIAKAVGRLGFPAIRGSKGRTDAPEMAKGGAIAFREALRQLRIGAVAVTPDGPRGPARQMGEGMPLMARLSKAPVLFIGMACDPAIRVNSWDKAVLPLPFGKGAIVWDIAHYPQDEDAAVVALAWTERLNAVEDQADAIVTGRPS